MSNVCLPDIVASYTNSVSSMGSVKDPFLYTRYLTWSNPPNGLGVLGNCNVKACGFGLISNNPLLFITVASLPIYSDAPKKLYVPFGPTVYVLKSSLNNSLCIKPLPLINPSTLNSPLILTLLHIVHIFVNSLFIYRKLHSQ